VETVAGRNVKVEKECEEEEDVVAAVDTEDEAVVAEVEDENDEAEEDVDETAAEKEEDEEDKIFFSACCWRP